MSAGSHWRDRAVCLGHETPDVFFPEPTDTVGRAAAALICSECPVANQCLATADRHQERHGIWGAMARSETTGQATHIHAGRPPKLPPTTDERCGTDRGYRAHRARNEYPCPPCLEAGNYASRYRRYGADTR